MTDGAAEPDDPAERGEDRDDAAGAPGASGPGEPGYEGEVTLGDEGGSAGPESFDEPFGRPDEG